MKRNMICTLATAVLLSISSTHAGVPPLMNYQGKLTDEYGVPVPDGNYSIQFRIYTDSIGGDVLWEELQWSVPVSGGLFSVLLGSAEDIPDTVFCGPVRWLGVQVSPDPELTPRKPIVSMAYAFRSFRTDTADYALNAPRDDDWLPDTSGFHIYRPAGNVGIGMISLESKLGVAGTAEVTGFKMPTGASDGYVLTSDSDGAGSWQPVPTGGSNWTVTDSVLYTNQYWGISRGGVENLLRGDSAHTHVNLGVACTTGGFSETDFYCTVGGGKHNQCRGRYSTIAGGIENSTGEGAWRATVGGGWGNYASDDGGTVGGGKGNSAYDVCSTISGGCANTAGQYYCTIGGGQANFADNGFSTVGGGYDNSASGASSTVGGGSRNTASGFCASVGGGSADTAAGHFATVAGGWHNKAVDSCATVSGGGQNYSGMKYATVAGGYADTVAGDYSFATGRHVVVDSIADHTFAFGRDFTTSTPNAVIFHNSVDNIKAGIGTPSPTATLDVNGSTGYNQVRMRTSYTPTGTADVNGNVGDMAWNDDYMYIKTSAGWKRAALSTF